MITPAPNTAAWPAITVEAATLNPPAAPLTPAAAAPPSRPADIKKLKALLNRHDRATQVLADTNELETRVAAEIDAMLKAGESLSEDLAKTIVVKRTTLEMVPAKRRKVEAEIVAIQAEMNEEFPPCFSALEKRFGGVREALRKLFWKSLEPVVARNYFTDQAVDMLLQHAKLPARAEGYLNHIRQPLVAGQIVAAARVLLKRHAEADEIEAETRALTSMPALPLPNKKPNPASQ